MTGMLRAAGRRARGVVGLAVVLGLWQAGATTGSVAPIVLPRPSVVADALADDPTLYLRHAAVTAGIAASGLLVGLAVACAAALGAWWSPVLKGIVHPLALIMRAVPIVAMIPVLARLVGYGEWTILVIAVVVVFFPAYILIDSGLRRPQPAAVELFVALGASRWSRLRRLHLPAAVPSLLTALRIGAAVSLVGAIIGEFLIGTQGLGYLFITARVRYQIPVSWAAAVVATVLSVAFFRLASGFERRALSSWS
jgi:ABC-type nitrate/sulfonate/bicarbonate transport system permease component